MFTVTEVYQDRKAAEFAQLAVDRAPLLISSVYKGIILTETVQVLSSAPGRLIVRSPDLMLCFNLCLKDRVLIYNRALGEFIHARMVAIDMERGRLELADFSLTGTHWYERQADRVQPRQPVYVLGENRRTLLRASLNNLSVGGLGIVIYDDDQEKNIPLERDATMQLTLQLPDSDKRLDVKGKVVYQQQVGSLDLVGMQLMCRSAQQKRIDCYVIERKAEIMAELERGAREFLDHRSMPCQYYS
jgi:hypothetical protein